MNDVGVLLAETESRYPAGARFLYGHSMGGNLVLNYALRRRPSLAGVIATSPWLRLAEPPPKWLVQLLSLAARVAPALSQGNQIDPSALSRDPAVGAAYLADPLVHNRISVGLFTSVRTAGYWALEEANSFPTPLLLLHGGADRVTAAKGSREFNNSAPDSTLKTWPKGAHELHNDTIKDEALEVIVNWLQARATAWRL